MSENIMQILKNINSLIIYKKIIQSQNIKSPLILNSTIDLAPGLTNIGSTCFHNSITQLFYRISELINFIVHPNVYKQYKNNIEGTLNPFENYINLLKLMKSKSSNENNNIITSDELNNLAITKTCKILMPKYNLSQEDAQEFLINLLKYMMYSCAFNLPEIMNDMPCYNMVANDPNNHSNLTLPDDDPRNFLNIHVQPYYCDLGIVFNGDFLIADPSDPNKLTLDDTKKDKYIMDNKSIIETVYSDRCKDFGFYTKSYESNEFMLTLSFEENTTKNLSEIIKENSESYDAKSYRRDDVDVEYVLNFKKVINIPSKYLIIHFSMFIKDYLSTKRKNHKINLVENGDGFVFEYMYNNVLVKKPYELIATCNQSGGLSSGHYVAYIKKENIWYEYNDSTRTENRHYTTYGTPYIALYREKTHNDNFRTINPNTIPENIMEYLIQI